MFDPASGISIDDDTLEQIVESAENAAHEWASARQDCGKRGEPMPAAPANPYQKLLNSDAPEFSAEFCEIAADNWHHAFWDTVANYGAPI